MMLEHAANVQDMLSLLRIPWFEEIDFGHLELIKTTFIHRDYRHLESDIVLTAPLTGGSKGARKTVLIYILIEHQSEPDRLMPLRLADSQIQIFRYQVRTWSQTHGSLARVRLSPVLPVVFYTGVRCWPEVGTLADLLVRGNEFRAVTPIIERPLFLNLPAVEGWRLERDGGFFGSVLRLIQQRKARRDEFGRLLEQVIRRLHAMPPDDRDRWRDLLSYIRAMIYHERSENEQPWLHEVVEDCVENEELRREVLAMGKTMADVLMEKGERKAAIETRQQTLVRLLGRRFGDIPAEVVAAVESTNNVRQLDEWLDSLMTASTLDELKIEETMKQQ